MIEGRIDPWTGCLHVCMLTLRHSVSPIAHLDLKRRSSSRSGIEYPVSRPLWFTTTPPSQTAARSLPPELLDGRRAGDRKAIGGASCAPQAFAFESPPGRSSDVANSVGSTDRPKAWLPGGGRQVAHPHLYSARKHPRPDSHDRYGSLAADRIKSRPKSCRP